MLRHVFDDRIRDFIATGEKAKNFYVRSRCEKLWELVKNCEENAFIEWANNWVLNKTDFPRGKDFDEFYYSLKRKEPKVLTESEKEFYALYDSECALCNNVGIFNVTSIDEGFTSLMKCICDRGTRHPEKLPQWLDRYKLFLIHEPCPIEFFKPEEGIPLYQAITKKVQEWNERIDESKRFWARKKQELVHKKGA